MLHACDAADPYVKIWLIRNGRREEKRKTSILKKTLNPQFNEKLTFQVSSDQVRYTSLEVYVMDFDRVGPNEPIGRVVLGAKSGPNEMKHWNDMLAKTKLDVTRWHVLRNCS